MYNCSHEITRWLLLGGRAMRNLDSVLKSQDTTFLTKVHIVKAVVFPVVMYACESWTIKKAECQRINAFKLWCWRRLLSPLDSKEIKPVNLRGNQLWILIGRTDDEAEAPILWPPDAKSCRLIGKDPDAEERLRRGGEVGDKGWDDCMTSLIQPTGVWTNSRRYRLGSKVWHAAVHGVTKLRTGLSNWTTIIKKL